MARFRYYQQTFDYTNHQQQHTCAYPPIDDFTLSEEDEFKQNEIADLLNNCLAKIPLDSPAQKLKTVPKSKSAAFFKIEKCKKISVPINDPTKDKVAALEFLTINLEEKKGEIATTMVEPGSEGIESGVEIEDLIRNKILDADNTTTNFSNNLEIQKEATKPLQKIRESPKETIRLTNRLESQIYVISKELNLNTTRIKSCSNSQIRDGSVFITSKIVLKQQKEPENSSKSSRNLGQPNAQKRNQKCVFKVEKKEFKAKIVDIPHVIQEGQQDCLNTNTTQNQKENNELLCDVPQGYIEKATQPKDNLKSYRKQNETHADQQQSDDINAETERSQPTQKRKPSTPVAELRTKIDVIQAKYEELEQKFQMTDAELAKIKEAGMKRQKISSSRSSLDTQKVIINLNVNYSPVFLNQHNALKIYLKENVKRSNQNFKPFGLGNPNILCFFISAFQQMQQINYTLTNTLLEDAPKQSEALFKKFIDGEQLPVIQQDANEYLGKIFEKCDHLQQLFFMVTHKEINCRDCGTTKSVQNENQWCLQVPVTCSVQLSLESYFGFQQLDDYKCDNCEQIACQEQQFLDEVNEIMVISFTRLKNVQQKDCTKIQISDYLTLKDEKYELIGFIPHIGSDLQSGHYVQCYKDKLGKWFILNDDKLETLKNPNLRQDAYICCFKKVFSLSGKNDSNSSSRKSQLSQESYKSDILPKTTPLLKKYQRNMMMERKQVPNKVLTVENLQKKDQDIHVLQKQLKDKDQWIQELTNNTRMTSNHSKLQLTKVEQEKHKEIKLRYSHLVDGPNQIQDTILCDYDDVDTVVESIQSSKKGKNKSKKYSEVPQDKQQKYIKDFLKKKFIIGEEIADFDKIFDVTLTYNIVPKLFQLIGEPFIDGLVVYLNNYAFQTKEQFQLFANEFISIKSVQSKDNQCLFIRLNDDHAKISDQLFASLLKMMDAYRSKVQINCSKQKLSAEETKKELQKTYIKQLDNTNEIAGLIYSKNLSKHLEDVGKMINMRPAWNYRSLKSCLQFEEYQNNNHSVMIGRQKFYCKAPLHLLQTEHLASSISMGLKPLLMPSTTFYRNLQQTSQDSLSRSERSEIFGSIEEEGEYLRVNDPQLQAREHHKFIIDQINSDHDLLVELNSDISTSEGWAIFWNNVKSTIIIYTESIICIVYGYNSNTRRYCGVMGVYPYGKSIKEIVKRYAVPLVDCHTYQLYEKNRYNYAQFKKISLIMQLPFLELCKNHHLTFKYEFFDVLPFQMVASLKPSEVEIIELGSRTTLSENQQNKRNNKLLAKLAQRYKKRSIGTMKYFGLKEDNLVHVLTNYGNKLYLYDDIRRQKFVLPFTKVQWEFLVEALYEFKFQQYGSKYIQIEGIKAEKLRKLVTVCIGVKEKLSKTVTNQAKLKRQKLTKQMLLGYCEQREQNERGSEDNIERKIDSNDEVVSLDIETCEFQNFAKIEKEIQSQTKRQENCYGNNNDGDELMSMCQQTPQKKKVQFQNHDFRYKGKRKGGFQYVCSYSKAKPSCEAYLLVDQNYKPVQLLKEHNLRYHPQNRQKKV